MSNCRPHGGGHRGRAPPADLVDEGHPTSHAQGIRQPSVGASQHVVSQAAHSQDPSMGAGGLGAAGVLEPTMQGNHTSQAQVEQAGHGRATMGMGLSCGMPPKQRF